VVCVVVCCAGVARAQDVSDEQTIGRLSSPVDKVITPYWANRLRGSIAPSEALAVDLGASLAHYAAGGGQAATSIVQFMLGASYMPTDHFAFDAGGFVSPQSTSVQRGLQVTEASKGAVRDKTSSFGFDVGAEYDTAGATNAESAIDLSVGATSYSTTQAVRVRNAKLGTGSARLGAPEEAALVQWRADANFIETLFVDTDVSLLGTYYLYNRDTTASGYYGASVFGRSVDDGIPVAPLQYSVRPSLTHRFGALQLRAYAQYGAYRYGDGSSLGCGLKAQYKFTSALRAWLATNLQRDRGDATGIAVDFLSASIGLRFIFN
jgi:hypothetical protein